MIVFAKIFVCVIDRDHWDEIVTTGFTNERICGALCGLEEQKFLLPLILAVYCEVLFIALSVLLVLSDTIRFHIYSAFVDSLASDFG